MADRDGTASPAPGPRRDNVARRHLVVPIVTAVAVAVAALVERPLVVGPELVGHSLVHRLVGLRMSGARARAEPSR
jgi:hypothetical protein